MRDNKAIKSNSDPCRPTLMDNQMFGDRHRSLFSLRLKIRENSLLCEIGSSSHLFKREEKCQIRSSFHLSSLITNKSQSRLFN